MRKDAVTRLDALAIAHEMKAAQDSRRQLASFSARVNGFDNDAAYEVAHLVHEARIREGASPVGRKIGFTNPEMWKLYGVREPIWAYLHDTTVVRLTDPRAVCRIGRFTEPRIEPEIVLHFRSMPATNDPAAILASIDWIAHGIEIVQSHFPDWKFTAADAIADHSLHGTLLVGEPQDVDRLGPDVLSRLERFTITLSCDGNVRERGCGSNVLGSPLAAAAHLVSVLAKQARTEPIRAGELVTTGTLTAALPIRTGEAWSTVFDGLALPGLSVTFRD